MVEGQDGAAKFRSKDPLSLYAASRDESARVSFCRINIIIQWIWQNPHKEGECVIIYFKGS